MVSCPGRGAALFTLLRRAGTHEDRELHLRWTPDQQRTVKDAALHPGNAGDVASHRRGAVIFAGAGGRDR
jgi:hypothetical protein